MSEETTGLAAILGQDGLIVLIAGGAFIAVAALLFFVAPSDTLGRRVRAVTSPERRANAAANALRKGNRATPSIETLRDLSRRLNLLSGERTTGAVQLDRFDVAVIEL